MTVEEALRLVYNPFNRNKHTLPLIAKSPSASYVYATSILKGRFEEGEPAIRANHHLWRLYAAKMKPTTEANQ